MALASSRSRPPGFAEAVVKGPGATSSCNSDALLVAPPFPRLRPSISQICVGPRARDTLVARILREADVQRVVDMDAVIGAVASAMSELGEGTAQNEPRR